MWPSARMSVITLSLYGMKFYLENFVKYHPSVFLSKEPGAVFDIELPNGLSSLQIRPI